MIYVATTPHAEILRVLYVGSAESNSRARITIVPKNESTAPNTLARGLKKH